MNGNRVFVLAIIFALPAFGQDPASPIIWSKPVTVFDKLPDNGRLGSVDGLWVEGDRIEAMITYTIPIEPPKGGPAPMPRCGDEWVAHRVWVASRDGGKTWESSDPDGIPGFQPRAICRHKGELVIAAPGLPAPSNAVNLPDAYFWSRSRDGKWQRRLIASFGEPRPLIPPYNEPVGKKAPPHRSVHSQLSVASIDNALWVFGSVITSDGEKGACTGFVTRSADDGATWSRPFEMPLKDMRIMNPSPVFLRNGKPAFLAGNSGEVRLYVSTDASKNEWQDLPVSGAPDEYEFGKNLLASGLDLVQGVQLGNSGFRILRSGNRGETWTEEASVPGKDARSEYLADMQLLGDRLLVRTRVPRPEFPAKEWEKITRDQREGSFAHHFLLNDAGVWKDCGTLEPGVGGWSSLATEPTATGPLVLIVEKDRVVARWGLLR